MQWLAGKLGGEFSESPKEMFDGLSAGAWELLKAACEGLGGEGRVVYDHHSHLVGLGHGETGCCIHPTNHSMLFPHRVAKFHVFMKASGIPEAAKEAEVVDRANVDRVVALAEAVAQACHVTFKMFILALDHWYELDGSMSEKKTGVYVPNDYVLSVAEEFPHVFLPVVSVHPYREDAIEELERCYERGSRMVKWLPNAMGIDPSNEKCDALYSKMKELGMVLLSHTGTEHSISICCDQSLGNPQLLERPLSKGVKVIAAHCASEGTDVDEEDGEVKDSFDLFIQMMDNKKFNGLLFADVSATTAFKRIGKPLTTILNRTDLHPRLVHGSDYPVPAINFVVQTKALVKKGYILEDEREFLNEIYHYNPLLFDFAVKRTIRSPDEGNKFSDSIFLACPGLAEIYPTPKKTKTKKKKKGDKKKGEKQKTGVGTS